MKTLAETCERIAATTKKLEKIAIVAEFLKSGSTGRGFGSRRLSFRQTISGVGGNHSSSRRNVCSGGWFRNYLARVKPN